MSPEELQRDLDIETKALGPTQLQAQIDAQPVTMEPRREKKKPSMLIKLFMKDPAFLKQHPNLYGAYGVAKGLAEAIGKVGIVKYGDPYEVKKLLKLSPKEQKRQLLMDTLESVTMVAFGAKAPGKPRIAPGKPKIAPRIDVKLERRTELFNKMDQALKEAASKRKVQEMIYTRERRKRFAKVAEVGKLVKGEKGYHAQLKELKGELLKVEYESIRGKIGQKEVDELFQLIRESIPNQGNAITAQRGLAKIFGEAGGAVPQDREIELLRTVFPEKLIKTLLKKQTLFKRMSEAGYQLANIPRSIMSSFDLSAPLRQGLFLGAGHPIRFTQSFFKMFRQFGSEKAYLAVQESIAQKATFGLMQESGLALTQMGKAMSLREERFMSQWAEKIPFLIGRGVRASGRAYAGFLNKLRADVFEDLVNKATRLGLDPKNNMKLTKEIAKFVNAASGRGGLGSLERSAVTLNSLFFSPRLIASRLQLLSPRYYVVADPFVRKEALKSLFALAGVGATILSLAKAGGADVETNIRSADFLKVKIGKTRLDILGGFQQYMRAAGQIITGQYISTTTGKLVTLGEGYRPLTRYEIGLRFAEQKLAPPTSFVVALMKGKDIKGEDIKISKEIADRFKPMALSDIYEIAKENPELLPAGFLAFFGVGIQTYGRRPSRRGGMGGIKGIGGIEKF